MTLLLASLLAVAPKAAPAQDRPNCASWAAAEDSVARTIRNVWNYTILPATAQSQTCSPAQRVTTQDVRDALLGTLASLGCRKGTGAFAEFEADLPRMVPSGTAEDSSVGGLPWHYLSSDPDFCEDPGLARIAACVDDPDCAWGAPYQ